MRRHVDFYEQRTFAGDEGAVRPDAVVHTPGGVQVVIDAKTPLNSYLDAYRTSEDETRRNYLLEKHAGALRIRCCSIAPAGWAVRIPPAADTWRDLVLAARVDDRVRVAQLWARLGTESRRDCPPDIQAEIRAEAERLHLKSADVYAASPLGDLLTGCAAPPSTTTTTTEPWSLAVGWADALDDLALGLWDRWRAQTTALWIIAEIDCPPDVWTALERERAWVKQRHSMESVANIWRLLEGQPMGPVPDLAEMYHESTIGGLLNRC